MRKLINDTWETVLFFWGLFLVFILWLFIEVEEVIYWLVKENE